MLKWRMAPLHDLLAPLFVTRRQWPYRPEGMASEAIAASKWSQRFEINVYNTFELDDLKNIQNHELVASW